MDNLHLILRQFFAEQGTELTPKEAKVWVGRLKNLLDTTSYAMYARFLSMDDDEIRTMASKIGFTYERAKVFVETTLMLGHLKYGGL